MFIITGGDSNRSSTSFLTSEWVDTVMYKIKKFNFFIFYRYSQLEALQSKNIYCDYSVRVEQKDISSI